MAKRYTVAAETRTLLEAAGYVWDETCQEWVHVVSKRQLDPAVEATYGGATREVDRGRSGPKAASLSGYARAFHRRRGVYVP